MSSHGEVPIDVTSRHGHVSHRMVDYATRKAERLPRFNDQISRIEIVVDGPHEAPEVEMLVHIDNAAHVVAKERSDHFNSAVDRLVEKIERQIVKAKQKLKKHRTEGAKGRVPEAEGHDSEETFEDAVRKNLES